MAAADDDDDDDDSQFDKTDACTLIVTHRLIISYDSFLIVCIIDYFVKF